MCIRDSDKAGYNNADNDIYSIVNINGTKQQTKEKEAQGKSEKPLQSIKSDDNSSFLKKNNWSKCKSAG